MYIPKVIEMNFNNLSYLTTKCTTIMYLLKKASTWEKEYTIDETGDGKFWIHELKGLSFETKEKALDFAFICWCSEKADEILGKDED